MRPSLSIRIIDCLSESFKMQASYMKTRGERAETPFASKEVGELSES